MTSMNILIATAEQEIYRGHASMVIVTSVDGEIAIMPGHAPLLATLRPGEVRISCRAETDNSDCNAIDIVVLGGFLEVQPDAIIILADAVERLEEIDAVKAQKALKQAKKLLASSDKDIAVKAMFELELAIARLSIVRRNSKQSFMKPS